jgi:hypothetical protein
MRTVIAARLSSITTTIKFQKSRPNLDRVEAAFYAQGDTIGGANALVERVDWNWPQALTLRGVPLRGRRHGQKNGIIEPSVKGRVAWREVAPRVKVPADDVTR